jgi:hypothetical protein
MLQICGIDQTTSRVKCSEPHIRTAIRGYAVPQIRFHGMPNSLGYVITASWMGAPGSGPPKHPKETASACGANAWRLCGAF